MTPILETIVAEKRREVQDRKELYPVKLLQKSIYYETPCVSMKKYLLRSDLNGIIAEFKRKSPSKGIINEFANAGTTTLGYMQAGASALSVLTDQKFFGGTNEDLIAARKFNFCPILRKDFIIDPYQITEAKSIGADTILLIAAILTNEEIKTFSRQAMELGMEVIFEVHDAAELEKIPDDTVIVGVNNRNLKTMETDIETSHRLLSALPSGQIKVAESGINRADIICELKQAGYHGFLIGEFFMQHSRPEHACRQLIQNLKTIKPC